jgi:hypothetical protein
MLVTYALESKSEWFILAFAFSCALGSAYGVFARRVAIRTLSRVSGRELPCGGGGSKGSDNRIVVAADIDSRRAQNIFGQRKFHLIVALLS